MAHYSDPKPPVTADPVLWVNPIPMECGALSQASDRIIPRLTSNHLKKLTSYTRHKGKHAYPWLSYSVWQHIAKNKLNISEDISWQYFETFDSITDVDVSDRLKMMNLVRKCSNKDEVDRLHRQNTPRTSLISPIAAGDEWPSPEKDSKTKSHKSCIEQNLLDILDILCEPGNMIDSDGVRALEFLFLVTTNKKHLLPLSTVLQNCGICQGSQSVTVPVLESWIRAHLHTNPYGPQAMKSGSRDKRCPCYRSETMGRVVSNHSLAPLGSQCTLLHGINKQTLAKDDDRLVSNAVYIQNCKGSFIYLLAPLKCVVIEKCIRCVIVLGVVERCVIVTNSSAICLITACRRIQIRCPLFGVSFDRDSTVYSTVQSTFHLLTVTRPVLMPNNHSLILAPYNTYYPKLDQHMAAAGLISDVNLWDNPINLAGGGGSSAWSLLDPINFYKTEIPFKMEGTTKKNPYKLPEKYQKALDDREQRILAWHKLVKDAKLPPEKQQSLQIAVQEKFKEWLEVTGSKQEIYDLGRGSIPIKSPSS